MTAPLSGMTGFARGESRTERAALRWELRSVNAKGLDVRLRLPAALDRIEAEVRNRIKTAVSRGAVTATLTLDMDAGEGAVTLDRERLQAYADAARSLVEQGLAEIPRADGLLALKGVVTGEEAEPDLDEAEALDAAALEALGEAIDGLKAAREAEGAAVLEVLNAHVDEVERLTRAAADLAAARPEAIRDRIKAKFDELLPQGLDEDRLAQEAAALAVKADVREELDRLSAHVAAARGHLHAGSPVGRKLDFLAQEFNREANTLCSKSQDRALTDIGLAMKAVIDQLREQVQNVE